MLKLSLFDYNLPRGLIATEPAQPRDHSRLMLVDKQGGKISHHFFYDLPDLIRPSDLLVFNDTKVFSARLMGQKETTHGAVEILLDHEIEPGLWQAIGRNTSQGARLVFPNSALQAGIEAKKDQIIHLRFNLSGEGFFKEIERIGQTPLPPYINKRRQECGWQAQPEMSDQECYQTVYARNRGSVAAPTAGLHFTDDLLGKIKKNGAEAITVTLHVGYGTFASIEEEDVTKHQIHSESFSVSKEALVELIEAKKHGRRIVAIGTTTARVLETIFTNNARLLHTSHFTLSGISGWTNIFIYPGYKFKCVDAMITNFHLPKSSLLLLVSAFASRDLIMKAYGDAIKNKYRFYSYGDAMLIV